MNKLEIANNNGDNSQCLGSSDYLPGTLLNNTHIHPHAHTL